ncbi:MAG: phosphopantothenoylcysteine decarboxylase [Phycisphaerae bacterium]
MKILITAGPTREYIDTVRFISNASSGRMGLAVAKAALQAGHQVTLLLGPIALNQPEGATTHRFTGVDDLKELLAAHFPLCDVLVMAAAVGDFRPEKRLPTKIPRKGGPVTIRLFPTEDILAGITPGKRADQRVISFSVEDGPPAQVEAKAKEEMLAKGSDFVVVNPPSAMDADSSHAAILSAEQLVLPWEHRSKLELAEKIVELFQAQPDRSADTCGRTGTQ